jgi:hypothetical protein
MSFKLHQEPQERLFVALRLTSWKELHLATNSRSIGFLPVYASKKAMEKDYPTCEHALIERKPKPRKKTK